MGGDKADLFFFFEAIYSSPFKHTPPLLLKILVIFCSMLDILMFRFGHLGWIYLYTFTAFLGCDERSYECIDDFHLIHFSFPEHQC